LRHHGRMQSEPGDHQCHDRLKIDCPCRCLRLSGRTERSGDLLGAVRLARAIGGKFEGYLCDRGEAAERRPFRMGSRGGIGSRHKPCSGTQGEALSRRSGVEFPPGFVPGREQGRRPRRLLRGLRRAGEPCGDRALGRDPGRGHSTCLTPSSSCIRTPATGRNHSTRGAFRSILGCSSTGEPQGRSPIVGEACCPISAFGGAPVSGCVASTFYADRP
jgi:hypothetical protein